MFSFESKVKISIISWLTGTSDSIIIMSTCKKHRSIPHFRLHDQIKLTKQKTAHNKSQFHSIVISYTWRATNAIDLSPWLAPRPPHRLWAGRDTINCLFHRGVPPLPNPSSNRDRLWIAVLRKAVQLSFTRLHPGALSHGKIRKVRTIVVKIPWPPQVINFSNLLSTIEKKEQSHGTKPRHHGATPEPQWSQVSFHREWRSFIAWAAEGGDVTVQFRSFPGGPFSPERKEASNTSTYTHIAV